MAEFEKKFDDEVNNKSVISQDKWVAAIAEASAQLSELQMRVTRLKTAIKYFSAQKKLAGESA